MIWTKMHRISELEEMGSHRAQQYTVLGFRHQHQMMLGPLPEGALRSFADIGHKQERGICGKCRRFSLQKVQMPNGSGMGRTQVKNSAGF